MLLLLFNQTVTTLLLYITPGGVYNNTRNCEAILSNKETKRLFKCKIGTVF